jgi:hypothetical protein
MKLVVIIALTVGLLACGGDPGKRFFALEAEMLEVLAPYPNDAAAATRALCAWMSEHEERIVQVRKEFEAYEQQVEASKDKAAIGILRARKEVMSKRYQESFNPHVDDPVFWKAGWWFASPSGPVSAVCPKG